MKKLFNKKFPTMLGVILILIGIPLTTFVLKNQTIFKSGASGSQLPQDVKATNVSDKSFTVTYLTSAATTGSISYGVDKNLGGSALEDLDKEKGSFSPKKIHSISLKDLLPNTKYYLTITSGSNTFLNNNVPFEVMTGPSISSPSARQNVVKGKIILPDGSAPSEAIIYLKAGDSQVLSATVAKDGIFNISLKDLRTDDLSSYFDASDSADFNIIATNGTLKSTTSVSLTQEGTIPTITLSNNYDFSQETPKIASQSAGQSSGFPVVNLPKKNLKPEIVNPKTNQSFSSQKPQFRGTSLPNEKVEITIHSDEQITTQVTSDASGNWTYQPPSNLSPGPHTITIKTRDSSGILTTIMQSFTVYAADAPTPTLTNAPPLLVQNVLPTLTLTPTPTLAQITSITPFPTTPIFAPIVISTTPTPSPIIAPLGSKGGLPPTGNSPTLLIIGGIISTLTGLALLFFTRKTYL